ncbi:hypothetical protein LCGC14_1531260 [marine sediment metagenome]|uniref:Uncharacterized protein n=1 Tax=marine sediment metagenome TaxID=412755 RepID=A0A0F9LBL4_9ZZZZ
MKKSLNNALQRYMDIIINPKSAQILGIIIDPPPPPSGPYFSSIEQGYYVVQFVILFLLTILNIALSPSWNWAGILFGYATTYGAGEYLLLFAYNTQG